MRSLKVIAAAALMSTTLAAPAMARDYCDTHRCYHRGPVGAAADTAASNRRCGNRNRGRDRNSAVPQFLCIRPARLPREGFACEPGTWFTGADGRRHLCQ